MQEWPEYTQKYIEQCAAQKFTTGMNIEKYTAPYQTKLLVL